MDLIEKIKEAGVVGAGGAGFPTHIKLGKKADIVIANGAECEPLLWKDKFLLNYKTFEVIEGLKAIINIVGAKKGIIALKEKHKDVVNSMRNAVSNETDFEIFLLDDFYPSGDEHILVNEITGMVVPEGGIPSDIGILVHNIETLYNIQNAIKENSVTKKTVSIMGEVKNPQVITVPIGISIRELIDFVGGATVQNFKVIINGPMMGNVVDDNDIPIDKMTSGLLILPSDSYIVNKKSISFERNIRLSKSVCLQCIECTILCPRNLLGHSIEPHKIMRSINYKKVEPINIFTSAFLCSECSVCEIYACVMGLSPKVFFNKLKKEFVVQGIKNPHHNDKPIPNMFKDERRIPFDRLINKLHLTKYNVIPEYDGISIYPSNVKINLTQHYGVPAEPIVHTGDKVKEGQIIGEIPDNKIGAKIHSSINGIVRKINSKYIEISD